MKRFAAILALMMAASAFGEMMTIDNGLVEVAMDDSTGRFSMGKPSGTPYIAGFPSSGEGGYVTIRIDGTSYSNKPGRGTPLTLLDAGRIPEDYFMTIQWIRDPIRLWQKFYLMPEESLDAFCDIELLAYNDDADSHAVGFKLYIDPTVGGNTNPILEFATGVENTTCRFVGSEVPAYWTLYEHSVTQDTSYALTQGVPFGTDMLYPDDIAFANVDELDRDEWWFSFFPGSAFTDLAMACRWDNIILSPYSWYIVQIYYGGGYPSFGVGERRSRRPQFASLGNPYPNPFNAKVSVPFDIFEHPQLVSWNIYDLTGRVVKHSSPKRFETGEYRAVWDGKGDRGNDLPSGIYLFALWADGIRQTKTIVIVE